VHPNLVQYFFNAFNCIDVDGEKRMLEDLEITCYTGYHIFWACLIALPSLIVWGIGIPLFAFTLLNKEKDRLKRLEVKEKYGFLYNGYRKDFYYWEVVIMYRKIALVFIAVFVGSLGVITQALFVFMFVIFFLVVNLKKKPFSQVALNDLETLSLSTSMITIYCGIFFLSDMPEVYNSNDPSLSEVDNGLRLSEGLKLLMFFVIVFANLGFFLYWLFKMYKEMKAVIIKKFDKVYLFACLCGDREKLERIKYAIAVEEENELLREDFLKSLKLLKKLYTTGTLTLNAQNIEKLQCYLNQNKVLEVAGQLNIVDSEEDKKRRKRMQRVKQDKE